MRDTRATSVGQADDEGENGPDAFGAERGGQVVESEEMIRPSLEVIDGEGLTADAAAWLAVADTARAMVRLPGLSAQTVARMERLQAASLRAARPLRQSPQATPKPL